MDHVVYVDAASNEMEKLVCGYKSMIIRGAAGRKMPYEKVKAGDTLYFINNNGEGLVRARAGVKSVFNSERLAPLESSELVEKNLEKLQLTEKQRRRWEVKRYLVIVEIGKVEEIEPFPIDKSGFKKMDDWLPVNDIARVKM